MIGKSKDDYHLVRLGKSRKSRASVDMKVSIVSVVVHLFFTLLFFHLFDPQTYDFSDFVYKNSDLIAVLVSYQFPTFDTDMFLPVELNRDIISREACRTAI